MSSDGSLPSRKVAKKASGERRRSTVLAQLLRATVAATRCAEHLDRGELLDAQVEYDRLRVALDQLEREELDDDSQLSAATLLARQERLMQRLRDLAG